MTNNKESATKELSKNSNTYYIGTTLFLTALITRSLFGKLDALEVALKTLKDLKHKSDAKGVLKAEFVFLDSNKNKEAYFTDQQIFKVPEFLKPLFVNNGAIDKVIKTPKFIEDIETPYKSFNNFPSLLAKTSIIAFLFSDQVIYKYTLGLPISYIKSAAGYVGNICMVPDAEKAFVLCYPLGSTTKAFVNEHVVEPSYNVIKDSYNYVENKTCEAVPLFIKDYTSVCGDKESYLFQYMPDLSYVSGQIFEYSKSTFCSVPIFDDFVCS